MFASCRSGRTLTIARGDHWTGIKSKNPDAPAVKREAEEYWVKGLRFLRAELPGILAKRTDVLSPRMLHLIEGLAAIGTGWTSASRACPARLERWPVRTGMRAVDDGARHRADHLERDGSRDRQWRRVLQGPRLRCLARTGAETDLDGRSHDPRQHIQARQSLSARPVRPGSLGRVGQGRAKALGALRAQVLDRGRANSGCTTTCWRLRLPTSSPASPGRFSTKGAPSSASRPMRRRPELLDPRAVLGPVKAWAMLEQAASYARRPALTAPARGAPSLPQAGTKERPPGTNKGTARSKETIDDVHNNLYPPRSARG